MLETIADKLTNCFNQYLHLSEIQYLEMALGFESILHNCILLAAISTLSIIMNIFYPTVIFLFVFATYRILAGGFHLNTSLGCTITTTTIIIGGTKIAEILSLNTLWTCILLLLSLCLAVVLAPRRTKNYPLTEKAHKKQKTKSVLFIVILSIVAIRDFYNLRELITIAITIESIMLLPDPQKI